MKGSPPPAFRNSSFSSTPRVLYRRHCRCSDSPAFAPSFFPLSLRKSSGLTLYNFGREPRINQRNAINRILIAILRGLSISNSRRAVLLVSRIFCHSGGDVYVIPHGRRENLFDSRTCEIWESRFKSNWNYFGNFELLEVLCVNSFLF